MTILLGVLGGWVLLAILTAWAFCSVALLGKES